jgi:hypothetical protein
MLLNYDVSAAQGGRTMHVMYLWKHFVTFTAIKLQVTPLHILLNQVLISSSKHGMNSNELCNLFQNILRAVDLIIYLFSINPVHKTLRYVF